MFQKLLCNFTFVLLVFLVVDIIRCLIKPCKMEIYRRNIQKANYNLMH